MKVSKIVLDLGSKKVALSLKEAQALKDLLNETFGHETTIYRDRWNHPYWLYSNPQYTTKTICSVNADVAASSNVWNITTDSSDSFCGSTLTLAKAA